MNVLKKESKIIIADFLTYDTISLRTYIEIVNKGDLSLLGTGPDAERSIAWEKIVKESGKHTGNMQFDAHFEMVSNYGNLLSDYAVIKATLSQLVIMPTRENVEYMASRGYKIETANEVVYWETLQNAITKSSNIVSKINAAYNELMASKGEEDNDETPATLGQLVASLNFALGSKYIGTDVMLSEYNEYKKIVKIKQRKQNG